MSNEPKEWFRVLDLRPGAGLDEVKRSYRELAKVWHPDRFAHDPSLLRKAHEKMNQLNHAYEQICGLLERFGANAFGIPVQGAHGRSAAGVNQTCAAAAQPAEQRAPATPPLAAFGRAGDATVRISWSPVYGAGGYRVKRSEVAGGPYEVIARDVTWTEYVDRSVTNGTRYYYVVSSVDGSQESSDSPEISAQPLAPPTPPSDVRAVVTEDGSSVMLDWKQTESAELTWHVVYRSCSGGEFVQIAQISAGTSYADRQPARGVPNRYVVRAVNSNAQQSADSNAAVAQLG